MALDPVKAAVTSLMRRPSSAVPVPASVGQSALTRARSALERLKDNPLSKLILLGFTPGQRVWHPTDTADLAEQGFEQNVAVYRSVTTIANAAAGVPWVLFDTKRAGKRFMSGTTRAKCLNALDHARQPHIAKALEQTEIDDHPLLRLIERPNEQQGQSSFLQMSFSDLLYSGNGYQHLLGPVGESQAAELWNFRPHVTWVLPGPRGVGGYEVQINGQKKPFKTEEVLHLKLYAPLDDWYGLSPIRVAARAINGDNLASIWNNALLANGARPSGALMPKGENIALSDTQFERSKKELKENYVGASNAGAPMVLDAMEWVPFSLSPKDMDWLQSRRKNGGDIAVIYGLSPELIGDTEHKKFSNFQEARRALYIEVVLPLLVYLRDEWNNWLVPKFGDGLFLDFDKDQITALQEDQAKLWDRVDRSNVLRVDEKRVMIGFEEIGEAQGGQLIVVPASSSVLTDLVVPDEEPDDDSDDEVIPSADDEAVDPAA